MDCVEEGALLYQEGNWRYLRVVDAVARIVGVRHFRTEVERGSGKPIIGVRVSGFYDADDGHGDDAGRCRVRGNAQYIPCLQPKLGGGRPANHGLQDGRFRIDWILRTGEASIDDVDVLVEVRKAPQRRARCRALRETRRRKG